MIKISYLNSIETANLLGVNVSTVKRWTDDGKLKCQKTAGGHRKFSMVHISDFVQRNFNGLVFSNIFPDGSAGDIKIQFRIIKQDFGYLKSFLSGQILHAKQFRFENVLKGLYLTGQPLHKIYDALVTPLLQEIGTMWEKGEITVLQEHITSQYIKDSLERLQGIVQNPARSLGPVFLFNPENELHDIALKMTDHILRHRGFDTLFSGQVSPAMEIEEMIRNIKPVRIYVGVTFVQDKQKLENDLNYLIHLADKYRIKVYAGGQGLDRLELGYFKRLYNFEQVSLI
ncbi:helix-turn-helix domain-containing protein [candidate division KSB1 bacterium]|nr:helix-turn-helix domain-containing protein [candidate division KSB1 bacterium]